MQSQFSFKVFALVLGLFSIAAQAKIIKEERSLYRNILVEDTKDIRCLKFSVKRKKSSQSCINKKQPQLVVFEYTKYALSSLVFNAKPENVLIIGLGGGTLSNILLEMYPQINIDNVEIDPAVVRVAREYFDFIETDKVKSYTQDGRIFVKRAKRKNKQYDLIILDAFNGEYIPEHLLTQEFLQETKSLLTDEGILVANTFSSSDLYHHESATYHAVFGDFYTIEKGFNRGNRVIIAGKQLANEQQIAENIEELEPRLKYYGVGLQKVLAFAERVKAKASDYRVLTDQYSPANLL